MGNTWLQTRTADTRRLNLKFFATQIQLPLPNEYLWVRYKGLVFCRNNGWIMENMDKGLTVPKWVLIFRPKIPQMPQKMSAQNDCPSQKVWSFWKKLFLGVHSPWLQTTNIGKQPQLSSARERKKQKNFLNSVGKLISNSIRETTGKSGMIEKDTILLVSSF